MPDRQGWVVDACVVYAGRCDLSAVKFLMALMDHHYLALDMGTTGTIHGGKIYAEYKPAIESNQLLREWFSQMVGRPGKFVGFSCNLPARCGRRLGQLDFHDDDVVYVAVAQACPSHLLVTEDRGPGDFDERVCEYLRDDMGIEVMDVAGALVSATRA